MSQRQKRILAIVAVVVLGIVCVGFLLRPKTESTANKPKAISPANTTVTLNNPDLVAKIVDDDTVSSLEHLLYKHVADNTTDPQPAYSGTIREGSINSAVDDTGYPTTTFLVDIPDLLQSYQVEVDGDTNSEFRAINVFCPTQNQLKYTAFTCVDEQ